MRREARRPIKSDLAAETNDVYEDKTPVSIESTPNIVEFLSRFFGIGSILNLRGKKFKRATAPLVVLDQLLKENAISLPLCSEQTLDSKASRV